MASASHTLSITTQTTIYLPTIFFDETKYLTWLFRLEFFVKGQNLYGFVDGSVLVLLNLFMMLIDLMSLILSMKHGRLKIRVLPICLDKHSVLLL